MLRTRVHHETADRAATALRFPQLSKILRADCAAAPVSLPRAAREALEGGLLVCRSGRVVVPEEPEEATWKEHGHLGDAGSELAPSYVLGRVELFRAPRANSAVDACLR